LSEPSLQAIADRLEIEEVLSRYAWAIDTKEFDGLDQVFTPDAFIDYESAGGIKGSYPEIKAWLASVLPHFPTYQHLVTNKHITIDGDTAVSRAAFYNPMGQPTKDGGVSYFYVGGEYHDKLVRTADGWRITERIEQTKWADGNVPAPPA
jgi:hypothetical protein